MKSSKQRKKVYRLFWMLQWIWGLPQTAAGFVLYRHWKKAHHGRFRGDFVTEWTHGEGLSMGPFIFISDQLSDRDVRKFMLLHEYGHSLQSVLLGPLYLLVIGLPSIFWCRVPACGKKWRSGEKSYYSFYTERLANKLSGAKEINGRDKN